MCIRDRRKEGRKGKREGKGGNKEGGKRSREGVGSDGKGLIRWEEREGRERRGWLPFVKCQIRHCYEDMKGDENVEMDVVWEVSGHPRSSAT